MWAIAERFPDQGDWTEAEYLALPDGFPRVELSDGNLEVLPMPTDRHQAVLTALLLLLVAHARRSGGRARPAGTRLRLGPGRFREPDVVYLGAARSGLRREQHWDGADLVVEIVSGGAADRARDEQVKRREYADAGVPEYWIVDPERETLTVLSSSEAGDYAHEQVLRRGDVLQSPTLEGLELDVASVLDAD